MAETLPSPSPRRRRRSTAPPVRMDMTPMVDLAFLLLTFFILTTSLRRLEGLELIAPIKGSGKTMDNRLTILGGGRDTLFGFPGEFDARTTIPRRYGLDQVRLAFRSVRDTAGLAITIKPRPNARYADVLGVVDACNLSGLRHYSIQDSTPHAEWAKALSTL